MERFVSGLVATVAVLIQLGAAACDAEKSALKIFSDQGLTVLKPARDYISVGGLVILPPKGRPEYIDPLDEVSAEPGTYVDFKAVVLGETKKQSTGIAVAVGLIGKLIRLPAGLTYQGGQQVQLSQIDCDGRRLTTSMVRALIKRQASAEEARSELTNGNRAFVVQEVYRAKTMTLQASNNTALEVSYGANGSLPACSTSTTQNAKSAETDQHSSASRKPRSGLAAKSAVASSGSSEEPETKSETGNTGDQGLSVGACRDNNYTLTFKSSSLVPFAVRLNELVLANGVLKVKVGGFNFPRSLGKSDVERVTAVIDERNPVLTGLVRRRR